MIKSYIIECDFCGILFQNENALENSAVCNYSYNGFDCFTTPKYFCKNCEDKAKAHLDDIICKTNEDLYGKALIKTSLGFNPYKEIIPELQFQR